MSVHVKNGTPIHGSSLCESCVHAHIERGFSESEEAVFCHASWPNHRVRFRVRQCSTYLERKRQSLKQMEEIAWILAPRGAKRQVGFVRSSGLGDEAGEIELTLDGAARFAEKI